MDRLAIVAGGGDLPLIGLENALKMGDDPIILGICESDFDFEKEKQRTIPIHLGKIGSILKVCKKEKIGRILLLGKVRKDLLFHGLNLDLKTLTLLTKTWNRNDYPIFAAVAMEFEKHGIYFESQKKYLCSLLLPAGRYTKASISSSKYEDLEFGMEYAKKIADLDIGQTVVVLDKTVVAVEAAEGTDEAIRRGGKLTARKGGAVVCKSSKSSQDERFDLPAVGIQTLQVMLESGCKTLAIREGETIVVRPGDTIQFANAHKLNLISYGTKGKKANLSYKKITDF